MCNVYWTRYISICLFIVFWWPENSDILQEALKIAVAVENIERTTFNAICFELFTDSQQYHVNYAQVLVRPSVFMFCYCYFCPYLSTIVCFWLCLWFVVHCLLWLTCFRHTLICFSQLFLYSKKQVHFRWENVEWEAVMESRASLIKLKMESDEFY